MRVVVANPSSNPEIRSAVAALARTDRLDRYYLPLGMTPRRLAGVRRAVGPLGGPLLGELERRVLPREVPRERVRLVGTASDLSRVAVARLSSSPRRRMWAAERHWTRFDTGVARRLRPGDRSLLCVLGSASVSLERARTLGAKTVLNSTLIHPAAFRAIVAEESADEGAALAGLDFRAERFVRQRERELAVADRILVASSYAAESLTSRGIDAAKIVVVPLGVDIDLFRPRPRAADGRFRILYVGRASREKGLSYLLEAFGRVAGPEWELLLVGQGTEAAAACGGSQVRSHPPVARADLPKLYASADVFVLPSVSEAFGLTGLEAMAMGLPTVMTRNSFARDLITQGVNGYVVPIRDSEAIGDVLRTLHSEPELRRTVARAARACAEEYTWRRHGERVVQQLVTA